MSKERIHLRPAYTLPEEFFLDDNLRMQTTNDFGDYAFDFINELRIIQPAIPSDGYLVGDNWLLAYTWFPSPQSQKQKEAALNCQNLTFMRYEILQRRNEDELYMETIGDIVEKAHEDFELGFTSRSMLSKFSIINRTSIAYPLLEDERIKYDSPTNWGSIVKMEDYPTFVYFIKRGSGPYIEDNY